MKPISVMYKGNEVYFIDAQLISDGEKTMRVLFKEKIYFFPKVNCEMITPTRFALKIEFYDILFDQSLFKRTSAIKQVFRRNKQNIPSPRMPRIGKN